jgi:long-subunit fatty acid transport protein
MLENSTTLSSGAVWTPLTNGMVRLGVNYVVTNNVNASTSFYRLHKP